MTDVPSSRLFSGALVIASLGYFVDVYDLILFSVVRLTSLKDLGLTGDALTSQGITLLNAQMFGMLLGGVVWGVLGDKIGRKKALFGSILLYSSANLINACIDSTTAYGWCRFAAGIGLAGELGAGVTLVAELLPKRLRGYGTTIIASIGILGAVVAGVTGELLPWRYSYFIGGVLGLLLLAIRISVSESELFTNAKEESTKGIFTILTQGRCFLRYICCVVVGLPIWFIIGILVTLAPEITKSLGAPQLPNVGLAVTCCYAGLFVGDIVSGLLSQWLQSRKRALGFFLLSSIVASLVFLSLSAPSLPTIYGMYLLLGASAGFWVLVVTTAAEQFGTNVRATVTTTVPNVIRGAVVPMTTAYSALSGGVGPVVAAMYVGIAVFFLAVVSLMNLKETFHNDLNFIER